MSESVTCLHSAFLPHPAGAWRGGPHAVQGAVAADGGGRGAEGRHRGPGALQGAQPGPRPRMPAYCIAYSVLRSASFQLSCSRSWQRCGRQTLCQWCLCLPGCGARVRLHWSFILQGIANLVGVTWLGSLLRDASIKAALASSSLGFVAGAMPFLQVQ